MSDSMRLQLILDALDKTGSGTRSARKNIKGVTTQVALLAGKFSVIEYAARRAFRLLNSLVFDFNSTLESANLSIATAFISSGRYIDDLTGKALEGQAALKAAQGDALRITEELQVANFQTIATLRQLTRAYQETLPVAMARGFDRQQVKEYTVAMVQAAGAIGMSLDQLAEETRSMLTGAINPRTSRIATVLGLRNEDVARYKGNADGLFNFLMGKLAAYKTAGLESQKTWAGVWSNTIDLFNQISAKVSEPIFETVKAELIDIADSIVTIDTTTNQINWNPEFMQGVQDTKAAITAIIAEVYRMSMLLDKIGGTLTAIGALTTFGDWDKKFREWNKSYEQRYRENERKLQELANRSAGLNSDGSKKETGSKATYRADAPDATGLSGKELKAYQKSAKGITDAWQQMHDDRFAIKSRALDVEIQLEQEAAALNKILWDADTDFWQLQEQERFDVRSRGLDELLRIEQQATAERKREHEEFVAELLKSEETAFTRLASAADDLGWSFSSAFEDAIIKGGELSEVLQGLLEDIERIMLRSLITQPLASAFASGISGLFSPGAVSSAAGISGSAQTQLNFLSANVLHGGGPFVPKFHVGGLNADEGYAVLQKGERVLSIEQNQTFGKLAELLDGAGGGRSGPLSITLVNKGEPMQASVQQRQSGGGTDLVVTLERAMADRMRSSGSPLSRSIEQTFGVKRNGVR